MTKPDPRITTRDKIAGLLARPIANVNDTATDIIRGLLADGWRPPAGASPAHTLIADLLGPRRPPDPPSPEYVAARQALRKDGT